MQIQVNSDNHIVGRESLSQWVQGQVEGTLERFGEHIRRVEVHPGDENSVKRGSDDKRCMLEARVAGLAPVAVTHHAASLAEAVSGALDKLEKSIDRTLGRLTDSRRRAPGDEVV